MSTTHPLTPSRVLPIFAAAAFGLLAACGPDLPPPCTIVVDSSIETDTIWGEECRFYEVKGYYSVSEALEIRPGTEVIFDERAGLTVNGSLAALGSDDAPIVFRGKDSTKGFWAGIAFISNASKNELSHVKLSGAGAESAGHDFRSYGVLVKKRLKVSHSVFSNMGSKVAFIVDDGATIEGFANNRFESNDGFPIALSAHNAGELDSESDFAGPEGKENGRAWILLNDRDFTKGYEASKTQTWRKQNVPYRFAGTVSIEGSSTTITIEAGTRLEFEEGRGIYVQEGTLIAKGSSQQRITFTGVDTSKGYWSGLYFKSNQSRNELDYAVVTGGGASGYNFNHYGVGVEGRLSITNTEISNTSGPGLWINGGTLEPSDPAELRAQNTFSNNGDNGDEDIKVK